MLLNVYVVQKGTYIRYCKHFFCIWHLCHDHTPHQHQLSVSRGVKDLICEVDVEILSLGECVASEVDADSCDAPNLRRYNSKCVEIIEAPPAQLVGAYHISLLLLSVATSVSNGFTGVLCL